MTTRLATAPTEASESAPLKKRPAMNAYARPDALELEFQIPGVSLSNLDVSIERGNSPDERVLNIEGKRPRNGETDIVYSRKVRLPGKLDLDDLGATLSRGVLRLMVPRSEPDKPQKVAVTDGAK